MPTYMRKVLLILGCLLPLRPIQAAFLQECEGVIISRVPNPNPNCSEYVYCNGDDSYYCNGECTEPVHCNGTTEAPITTRTIVSTQSASTQGADRQGTSPLASTTTTRATLTTTMGTTLTTMSENPNLICKHSNHKAVFPYPANANYYYECISRYLLLQQCPQNFHFDKSLGKCTGMNPYRL